MKQQFAARFHQRQFGQRYFLSVGYFQLGFAVQKPNPWAGKANFRAGEQMHGLVRGHTQEWLCTLCRVSKIDVQIGSIFDNQNAFFSRYFENGFSARLAKGKTTGVMTVGNRVVEGHEVALLSGRTNLRAHGVGQRSFAVHIHAENGGVLA